MVNVDFGVRLLSALLMIALPLAVGIALSRRWSVRWGLALVGVASFLLSQAGHLPFNSAVLNPLLARLGFGSGAVGGWPLALSALLLGLSAGVFEEGARYLIYRLWIRTARTYREAVVFGLGHGGAEAVILGVLSLIQHVYLFSIQGRDLSAIVPPNQLEAARAQLDLYWSMPAAISLLGSLERAFALVIQIALSVIVLQAFVRRLGGLWFLAAVAWHALVDAVAVYAGVVWGISAGSVTGAVASEALVGLFALASLLILLRLRPHEPATVAQALVPLDTPPSVSPTQPPLRPERVDDTRYTTSG
ncbi:MAG TPA: YhfC family glutamic-type intramembrane protease [Anaerolineales bacterium]|nr:YhfC family glutamic-type intramembrane protease [Anaerolineales bacterium]